MSISEISSACMYVICPCCTAAMFAWIIGSLDARSIMASIESLGVSVLFFELLIFYVLPSLVFLVSDLF